MRRGLQLMLGTLGAVALVAGTRGVLRGAAEVPKGGDVAANVDSEYRFYAAWYPVFGFLLLRAARAPEEQVVLVRACGGGLLLAGTARVMSLRARGAPHPSQQVLMALEFAIPAVLLPWHEKVRRAMRLSAS